MSAIVRALAAMEVDGDAAWVTFVSGGGYLYAQPHFGMIGEVRRPTAARRYVAWYRLQGPTRIGDYFTSQRDAFLAVQRARFAHAIATANRAASSGR